MRGTGHAIAARRMPGLLEKARMGAGAGLELRIRDRYARERAPVLRGDAGIERATDQVAAGRSAALRRAHPVVLRVAWRHGVVQRRVFGADPAGGVDVAVGGRIVRGQL